MLHLERSRNSGERHRARLVVRGKRLEEVGGLSGPRWTGPCSDSRSSWSVSFGSSFSCCERQFFLEQLLMRRNCEMPQNQPSTQIFKRLVERKHLLLTGGRSGGHFSPGCCPATLPRRLRGFPSSVVKNIWTGTTRYKSNTDILSQFVQMTRAICAK